MIAKLLSRAPTSSAALRGCDRSSSQPSSDGFGHGVVSMPGSPMTSHSQYTREPAMCAVIAQTGQCSGAARSASWSAVSGAMVSTRRRSYCGQRS